MVAGIKLQMTFLGLKHPNCFTPSSFLDTKSKAKNDILMVTTFDRRRLSQTTQWIKVLVTKLITWVDPLDPCGKKREPTPLPYKYHGMNMI